MVLLLFKTFYDFASLIKKKKNAHIAIVADSLSGRHIRPTFLVFLFWLRLFNKYFVCFADVSKFPNQVVNVDKLQAINVFEMFICFPFKV